MTNPIAITSEVEDFALEYYSVKDRRSDYRVAEEISPVIKAFVRCDDQGFVFIAGGHKREQ